MEKHGKLSLNYPCYPVSSGLLDNFVTIMNMTNCKVTIISSDSRFIAIRTSVTVASHKYFGPRSLCQGQLVNECPMTTLHHIFLTMSCYIMSCVIQYIALCQRFLSLVQQENSPKPMISFDDSIFIMHKII